VTGIYLDYQTALRRMFSGSALVRTNGKRIEYAVSPGGPITPATARSLFDHALCHPADTGLFAGTPQSWKFHQPSL
jgi:hypothetical protein